MARIHYALPATLAAILLLVGYAFTSDAQPPGVPNPYAILSPTGQELIKAENTGTFVSTISLSQARDASGYLIETQAATNTITPGPGVSVLAYNGTTAGTLALTMPAAPVDGQRLLVFTQEGFSSATTTANTGQTIANPLSGAVAANGSFEFIYQLSATEWFRIQ